MDRDRARPRPDFEDQYGTGRGQSYRPGGARERTPPPRSDTYRARSPPRRGDYGDSYRGPRPRSRSPIRRDDFRRRSPFRDPARDVRGGDSYRARPRSPLPRRDDLPRDDLFRRDPPPPRDYPDDRVDRVIRDDRDRGGFGGPRSPIPRFRERSPPLKRTREPSPIGSRGRRTPPPAKRERIDSPPRGRFDNNYPGSRPGSPPRRRFSPDAARDRRPSPPRGVTRDYRLRSRSPLSRNDRIDPRAVDDWRRPRSPSPPRFGRQEYGADDATRTSGSTSRRTSPPPVHAGRPGMDDRPSRPTPTDSYDGREPFRGTPRRDSPPPREYPDDRIPPRQPYRADDVPTSRAPPSGPSGYRAPAPPIATPTGPGSAAPPTQPRASPVIPPSGPRGAAPPSGPRGPGGFGNDYGGRGGRGSFSQSFRGGRGGGAPGYGRGEPFNREQSDFTNAPPSGPRSSFSTGGRPPFQANGNAPTGPYAARSQRFGPNGQPIPDGPPSGPAAGVGAPPAGPPTGPKAQRRPTDGGIPDNRRTSELTVDLHRPSMDARRSNTPGNMHQMAGPPTGPRGAMGGPHPALASLPQPTPGGIPAAPLVDTSRVQKLQGEAERLRRAIDEKEQKKRKGLREWDRLARETELASLRSELADQGLRALEMDGRSGGAGEAGW